MAIVRNLNPTGPSGGGRWNSAYARRYDSTTIHVVSRTWIANPCVSKGFEIVVVGAVDDKAGVTENELDCGRGKAGVNSPFIVRS